MESQNEYWVKNPTNRNMTIGDLGIIIDPGASINLMRGHMTLEKIKQSQHLMERLRDDQLIEIPPPGQEQLTPQKTVESQPITLENERFKEKEEEDKEEKGAPEPVKEGTGVVMQPKQDEPQVEKQEETKATEPVQGDNSSVVVQQKQDEVKEEAVESGTTVEKVGSGVVVAPAKAEDKAQESGSTEGGSEVKKCKGTTYRGNPCKNNAMEGSDYCKTHAKKMNKP
jgi:hypothetical protein